MCHAFSTVLFLDKSIYTQTEKDNHDAVSDIFSPASVNFPSYFQHTSVHLLPSNSTDTALILNHAYV